MNRHSQQGSALLVVLGFLSFMIVSAAAFAIWMRTERVPSSALRRDVANRYLVKAALAQAMSRVDDAIRSHVFPGAWCTNDTKWGTSKAQVYRDGSGQAYDWWESRVFMPPDPEGDGQKKDKSGNSRYAPVTKTVSVLNLEALGYLPPGIVNDVRLLARSSWAAQWDYFNFDAGRYAFCAVNVSDFLDITKIAADSPRTSAPVVRAQDAGKKPSPSRFSLAYLFRDSDDGHANPNGGAATLFDERVHVNPGSGGEGGGWTAAPLVSLMDYNLSLGDRTAGNLYSPFAEWIYNLNKDTLFYRGNSEENSPDVKGAERQPFVTVSWFPSNSLVRCGNTADAILDISQEQNWPFPRALLQNENANLDNVFLDGNEELFWTPMVEKRRALCGLDRFSLFDYLDDNDTPLSLAIPCVERVPMITALAPLGSSSVTVEFQTGASPRDEEVDATHMKKIYETKIKITLGGMGVHATVIYPFSGGDEPRNFTTEAFARLVFVAEENNPAAPAPSVSLRSDSFWKNCRPENKNWTVDDKNSKPFTLDPAADPNCLFVTLPLEESDSWTPQRTMQSERNCWREKDLTFKDPGVLEAVILRRIEYYEIQKNARGEETGRVRDPSKPGDFYEIALRPFGENGELLPLPASATPSGEIPGQDFDTLLRDQYRIRPYLVTWARVKNEKDDTVDLVPATFEDDQTYNNINNQDFADNAGDNGYALGHKQAGYRKPILRFPGAKDMSFTFNDVQQGQPPPASNEWFAKACYAVDPRFNWAPENWWFDDADGSPTGQKWYDAVFGNGPNDNNSILNKLVEYEFGSGYDRGDRANDPFLFVSNLGYLQSIGELAFLPHLSNMSEKGAYPNSVLGDKKADVLENKPPTGSLYNGKPRLKSDFGAPTDDNVMPCALAAWKCYQNYRTNPKQNTFEFGANLYRRGFVNGAQGFYVNPYTQSDEVMLAALANPPLNYWAAGENYDWRTGRFKKEQLSFNDRQDRMFGNNSTPALSGQDINKVVSFLRRRFEDLARMIELPKDQLPADQKSAKILYVYQKAWEDMFDALDWSGALGKNAGEVYKDLEAYYNSDDSSDLDYGKRYVLNGGNVYADLNRYVRGKKEKSFPEAGNVKLHADRAVHTGENADPFDNTTCVDTLRGVDRMFLHSYWRDCFANLQQLFLIFVRAESTALGGAGEGTPAQQGGRAVALVWRDPFPTFKKEVSPEFPSLASDVDDNSYRDDRRPHKMRILFYRQFD